MIPQNQPQNDHQENANWENNANDNADQMLEPNLVEHQDENQMAVDQNPVRQSHDSISVLNHSLEDSDSTYLLN